jgi:serine/threonine protein kinase
VSRQHGLGAGDVVGDRFRLICEIGEGGMGRVFEAEDLRYGRRAAVKLISRRLAGDAEFRARFEREAQAVARANHPHVLPVFDHGSEAGYLYLATQLADTDLGYLIEERGRLDVDTACSICGQMAWALDWAHGRDVLHRDVKPENILLVTGSQSTHAYLADFGLARISDSVTLTQHGVPAGLSPAYAAPEQWEGADVSPASDQYALAATLYCCLAGQPPFGQRTVTQLRNAHLHEPPPPLHGDIGPGSEAISAALATALSKNPADRYGSCEELIAAVRDAGAVTFSADQTDAHSATESEHPAGHGRDHQTAAEPVAVTVDQTVVDPKPEPHSTIFEPRPPVRDDAVGPPSDDSDRIEPAPPAPRRRLALIAACAVAAVIVAGVAIIALTGGGGSGASVKRLTVGAAPSDVSADAGSVWVANQRDGTLTHVIGQKVTGQPLPAVPQVTQVAAADSVVWALSADGNIAGFDESTGQPVGPKLALNVDAFDVAAGHRALWIANGTTGEVVRVAINGQVLAEPDPPVAVGAGAAGIAVGPDRVWVVSPGAARVTWLDADDGHVMGRNRVASGVEDVAASTNAVWVASPGSGMLERLDSATGKVRQNVRVPATRNATLTASGSQIAYVDLDAGVARLIDRAGHIRVLASPGPGASAAALTAHEVWITYPRSNSMAVVSF